jgi:hypothetical protein
MPFRATIGIVAEQPDLMIRTIAPAIFPEAIHELAELIVFDRIARESFHEQELLMIGVDQDNRRDAVLLKRIPTKNQLKAVIGGQFIPQPRHLDFDRAFAVTGWLDACNALDDGHAKLAFIVVMASILRPQISIAGAAATTLMRGNATRHGEAPLSG